MRPSKRNSLLLLLLAPVCGAAQLILPSAVLERDQPVTVIYKTGLQATGKGQLQINWTDAYGRTVDNRTLPVELTDENEFRFQLDLRRAIAMRNEVRVHFSFDGLNKKGGKDHREEDAQEAFIASPPDRNWWDYMVMMWQGGSAAQFKKLQQVGVNAGKSNEHSMDLPGFLLENDMRWYVENMATDFYSSYHIYRPDRPYNWALLNAKELYKKDPSSKDALKREPSFSDPAWLGKIHDRLVESTKRYSPYRPIFYNLADESGIAELAGFWDFDFSDYSLGAMRSWLQVRYGTLANLNQRWGSSFTDWNAVTPETTREAMKRTDGNYSSWADHKEWMDISFANALKMGSDAIHSVDPRAYIGIEGAQMPGWGGYDYYRLSSVVGAMEPYDIGDNIEIIRSFHPSPAFVTTAFATGPWEKHRLWFELLHGARGHIIWDEKSAVVQADGSIGPRGKEVSPYWNELKDGIGALLINSVRQSGPVAIHYSQASMRTEWMLAQRPKGDAWVDRMSWTERKDSDFLRLRDSYCRLIEDEGLQYNFVAYGQVEQGGLLKGGYRVLILPRSSALSALEATAITDFVQQGGVLVVDGDAGTYDEHSRRLPQSSLAGLLNGQTGLGKVIRMDALNYHQQRITGNGAELQQAMREILANSGVKPHYAVLDANGNPVAGVETHEFRNEAITIIGLISNPPVNVDELGPPEFRANQPFEKPRAVRLVLPADLYAYDVRHAKSLGRVKELPLTVDPYEPLIFAFSPVPIPELRLSAPARISRGQTGRLGLSFAASTSAGTHVFHIDVVNPAGEPVSYYSGNVLAPGGLAEKILPLAADEKLGRWTINVKDLLSGQQRSASFDVF
jgi:Beta-galactosidase